MKLKDLCGYKIINIEKQSDDVLILTLNKDNELIESKNLKVQIQAQTPNPDESVLEITKIIQKEVVEIKEYTEEID